MSMYDKPEIKKKNFVERMKLESKLYVLNLIPPPLEKSCIFACIYMFITITVLKNVHTDKVL